MSAGYACRYVSAQDPSKLMPYVLQSLLIILPPSLYAATMYMIYGRIVRLVNSPQASLVRPERVTKIFVTGDVLAFLLQLAGAGLMAKADSTSLGKDILLVGLFVQLGFFGFFLVIAIVFDRRMTSTGLHHAVPAYGRYTWRNLLYVLFAAAAIVIGRCIFRVIEFAQGQEGYIVTHEAFMYLFDTVPMFLVQCVFSMFHGGEVFPGPRAGKTDSFIQLYERP